MDFKLEVVVIPVSDVDRANAFYKALDWRVDAARRTGARGADVSDVYHCASGFACRYGAPGERGARVPGPQPDRVTYASFANFADPDGNQWILQEITNRLPGR